ncbi:MAG: hypothetical protein EOL88_03375, partial [Bacteroidia bacterium]|nr:hypothetical protein [Bacteroidia bacterium]
MPAIFSVFYSDYFRSFVKNRANMKLSTLLLVLFLVPFITYSQLPSSFDLRDYNGENFVTSVKSQLEGTCWTHGTMAAIEGNLLMTGVWTGAGETGEPNLAEYHLDWWNGFNQHNNDDITPPTGAGLEVHMGGDYRVATAYLSRGEGAVRDIDGQSFDNPPLRFSDNYHFYYPRTVEWFTLGEGLLHMDEIKTQIMNHGVIATCMCYSNAFINSNYTHYQPPSNSTDPNHSVAIVGWDDNKQTQAPLPGAWICKNSWGSNWGLNGYFWISYYDKHACRHPEMGAIVFKEVEPMQYEKVFYHDYHGWRDQMDDVTHAANRFALDDDYILEAVSFFCNAADVAYSVTIYETMTTNGPENELFSFSGTLDNIGFHTLSLPSPLDLTGKNEFSIVLELDAGGMPYDRTSDIPVLLGSSQRTIVESTAAPEQSYFFNPSTEVWEDFFNYNDPSGFTNTGNFCIKGLASRSTVGISNAGKNNITSIAIAPNPARKVTQITLLNEVAQTAEIRLCDLNG